MEILMLILIIYLLCHLPAIIMLFMGLRRLKAKPEQAKQFLIAAGVYFLVGGGICASILT